MSTRSYIIVRAADGTYRRIYCHFDGYLEWVGATLINYHDSDASAQAIVNLGDLSSLNRRLDAPPGHSFANPAPDCTVAYGRDRGEYKNTAAVLFFSLEAALRSSEFWTYVWDGERWLVRTPGETELQPLKTVLEASRGAQTPPPG